MPSLDVVVSVYRETGAPALYAALATIHGRAPLRLAVFLHDGNANPTIAWSPRRLRMDCCAQFVVAYAALEARGARFWHDLASLSLDPVASAGVPWEYLWRGVLAGSDAELGDDCAGNRTVRERS